MEESPSLDMRTEDEFASQLKPIAAEMLLAGMGEEEIINCVKSVIRELNTGKGE